MEVCSQPAVMNGAPLSRMEEESRTLKKTVSTLDELVQELHKVFAVDDVDVDHVSQLMLSYKSNEAEWKKFAKFDRYRYTRNLVDSGNGKFNLMILCWGEGHASAIHDHADAHCFMKMLKGQLEEVRYAWPAEHDPNRRNNVSIGCHQNGSASITSNGNQVDHLTTELDKKCNTAIANSKCNNNKQEPSGVAPVEDKPGSCCDDQDKSNENEEQTFCGKEMIILGRNKLETNGVCYINDSLGLHRVENPSHADSAVSLHLYCPPFNACHVFNQQTGRKTKCSVTFWSKYGQKRNREIQESREPEDN